LQTSQISLRRKIVSLSINSFFQGTASSFTFFLLQVYAIENLGFSSFEIGLVISLGGFSSAITQPVWGRIVDRTNRRILVFLGFILSGLSVLAAFNSTTDLEYYLANSALNAFLGLANTSWLSMLGDLTLIGERGRVSGVANAFTTLGTGLFSPIAGAIMDICGYNLASIVGLSQFILAATTIYIVPEPERTLQEEPCRAETDYVEGNFRPFLVASILWSLIWSVAWPLFSVAQVKLYKLSKAEIGFIGSVTNATRLVLQPIWGYAADRIGRKPLLILSPIFASAIPLSYAIGSNLWHIIIGAAIGTIGFSMYFTASPTYLLDSSPSWKRGSMVSTFNAMVSLTNSVAPLIGGGIGEALGIRQSMFIFGIMRVVSSVLFVKIPETLRRNSFPK